MANRIDSMWSYEHAPVHVCLDAGQKGEAEIIEALGFIVRDAAHRGRHVVRLGPVHQVVQAADGVCKAPQFAVEELVGTPTRVFEPVV